MAEKYVSTASMAMSPRELPNSTQVEPGRYVSLDPEADVSAYNEIRQRKRDENRRFLILDVANIRVEGE